MLRMALTLVRLYVLVVLAHVCLAETLWDQCTTTTCGYDNVALQPTVKSGANDHYYIGGMFGIHDQGPDAYTCGPIRDRGIQNLEAFFWAIKKYSQLLSSNLIVDVGGVAMDSCSRPEQTIENLYSFEACKVRLGTVDPRNLMAYVGPDRSSESMASALLLKDMNRTQVSHAATSPALSDDEVYPYFLRTVPSDSNDAKILAAILAKLNVRYIMTLYLGNSFGRDGYTKFKEALDDGICTVYEQEISVDASIDDFREIVRQLLERQSTKHVVVYADATTAKKLLEVANELGAGGKFFFLGTSSWGSSEAVLDNVIADGLTLALDGHVDYNDDVTAFWNYFLSLKPGSNPSNPRNPWFNEYWESIFECKLGVPATDPNACDVDNQSLDGKVTRDVYVPYTLMAVDAITAGVKRAAASQCNNQYTLCGNLMNQNNRGTVIRNAIRDNMVFQPNGDVSDTYSRYKIMQIDGETYKEVGTYVPESTDPVSFPETIKHVTSTCPNSPCTECGVQETTPAPTTPGLTTSTPAPTPYDNTEGGKYQFIRFPGGSLHFTGIYYSQSDNSQVRTSDESMTRFEIGQKWIIALGALAGLGILAVIVFEIYILYKLLGTRIGRQWRTMWLGQLLLLGIFLAYLTLFAYIPVPTKATCGITRFGIGVSYAICYSVLLVKLMVLLTSKSTEALIPGDVESPNYLKGIYQLMMFVFAVGVQVVIDTQWLIQVPPETVKVITNSGREAWICNHYTWDASMGWRNMTGFVRTEFENHLISLAYVMFLILITTIVAMKAHGIITNHRESVFIGIAAGFSIPIWIAWALVGGLNMDHEYAHEFGDATIAFGLFLTATICLFSMFLPKVRQLVNMGVEGIYLEDDRDTYYGGSVIMAPPSYKSRPSSVIYVNNSPYNDPVVIGNGDPNAVHLRHGSSTYSAPVYVKRDASQGGGTKILKVTPDLTGKHPAERVMRRPVSEVGYGTYRKARSESAGGTLRRSRSSQDLGAL